MPRTDQARRSVLFGAGEMHGANEAAERSWGEQRQHVRVHGIAQQKCSGIQNGVREKLLTFTVIEASVGSGNSPGVLVHDRSSLEGRINRNGCTPSTGSTVPVVNFSVTAARTASATSSALASLPSGMRQH